MLSRSCSQKSLLVVLVTVVRDPPVPLPAELPAAVLPPASVLVVTELAPSCHRRRGADDRRSGRERGTGIRMNALVVMLIRS